ncbi:MAG: hypothetical protein ABIA67_03990 [Candidatus Margulisiibacteriota bacterium]
MSIELSTRNVYGGSGYFSGNVGIGISILQLKAELHVKTAAGNGVMGESDSGFGGVFTTKDGKAGLYGGATVGQGVYGTSTKGSGVFGYSKDSAGVYGTCAGGTELSAGVYGKNSGEGIGVRGTVVKGYSGHFSYGGKSKGKPPMDYQGLYADRRTGGKIDLAENIETNDPGLIAGDVVIIDPGDKNKVKLSNKPYDTLAAGIISTDPDYTMGANIKDGKPVALAGRVPCKVSAENGPIEIGDLLTTSSTPGHAMKVTDKMKAIGAMVGKALEPLASGKGKIMVLVTLQ